jgi:hypothetical protein
VFTARSAVPGSLHRAGFIVAFCAGAAVAAIGGVWLSGNVLNQSDQHGEAAASFPPNHASGLPQRMNGALIVDDNADGLPRDFACRPRAGESPQEEFDRLLRELVQSPDAEHEGRLFLLLARLRQRGAASVPVVLRYLETGRDLSAQTAFGQVALFSGGSHYQNLRKLLFLALAQIAEEHPDVATQAISAGLAQARHVSEATALAAPAALDPTTRNAAIATLIRLLDGQPISDDFHATVGAMARLKGAELAPVLARLIENAPAHVFVDTYLAGLWNLPDAIRAEMSARLLASERIRNVMREHPESWQWLDSRNATFRAAMAQDFEAATEEDRRCQFLKALALDRKSAQPRFHGGFPIGSTPPLPGAPDSREQARARIALLDELVKFCNTPMLQSQRDESRARLEASILRP